MSVQVQLPPAPPVGTTVDGVARKAYSAYDLSAKRAAVVDAEEKKRLIYNTSYEPSPAWWAANQADYIKPEEKDDPLPAGFPAKVESNSVWDGKVLINQPEKWLYTFTPTDIAQIESAYTHFTSLSIPAEDISESSFPIPSDSELYKALKNTTNELNAGLGFRVLRGLPVDEWERIKQIVIFAGISSYISRSRIPSNNDNIVHLRDITNLPADKRPPIVVKGQTNGNQVFHNDGNVGIISLLTLGVAETGGLSQLSSVGQTYNELAATRRDIVRELAKDDWVNKGQPEGRALIHTTGDPKQPVISVYSRRPYFGFYESDPDVPALPAHKHIALDAIHLTAERFSLDVDLQKGDLEYVNNVTVYHARTASEDSEKNQRHLIRLWLENNDQALPEDLAKIFRKSSKATGWPLEAWD